MISDGGFLQQQRQRTVTKRNGYKTYCILHLSLIHISALIPLISYISSSHENNKESAESVQRSMRSGQPYRHRQRKYVPQSTRQFRFSPPVQIPRQALVQVHIPFPAESVSYTHLCMKNLNCFQTFYCHRNFNNHIRMNGCNLTSLFDHSFCCLLYTSENRMCFTV